MNSPCSCGLTDAWRGAARRKAARRLSNSAAICGQHARPRRRAAPRKRPRRLSPPRTPCALSNPHFLVSNVDARDGRELAELEAYRRVAEAVSAGLVLEIVIPDERDAAASLAPVAEAVRRARLTLEVGRRLERGRFEILAARRKAPRETDGRRDLHSCARCFSRRKAWRRHALHLHRTQSKAAEGRAFRLCDPYDMLDRSCCRRSLCDGDARNAVGHHRLDQGDDWR